MLPVLLVAIGVLFDAGMLLANRHEADRAAEAACQRAIKPTRTMIPSEQARRQNALHLFDAFIKQSGLSVKSRDATVKWIDVGLTANFEYETYFANILGITKIDYSVALQCSGIPPFPHDGEVILDTNFVKPDGDPIFSSYYDSSNCWGVYRVEQFGWDAGTGPGVEIQDWDSRCRSEKLPASNFPSRYVVELDSHANSSMTKIVELHPGTYQFSLWYNGRINDTSSNGIAIYLRQREPQAGTPIKMFTLSQPGWAGWQYFEQKVTVPRYSIYDLTIAAEGTSDSYGGLINAFNVKYVNTLK